VIQRSSLAQDERASLEAAWDFHRSLEDRAQADAEILGRAGVRLVVGDIPPLAFAAAAHAQIPSLAISNFTWDWIYEPWIDSASELQELLKVIRAAYAQASHALLLPFGDGFDVFRSVQPIPLVARHATRARGDVRRRFRLPDDRPIALLSFGGFGLPALDLSAVDCLNEWTVVTLDRPSARSAASPQIVCLDEAEFFGSGVRYEDLVAAVDVVISKPGYGIISECLAAGTALLYTSRGDFREYDVLVREMPRYVRCGFIAPADLLAGRWRAGLEAVRRLPAPPESMATNGAEVAAEIIATMGSWL
jgi:L-arabinokinase